MEDERRIRKRVHGLVVDPDEQSGLSLQETLQESGFFIDLAKGGQDAIGQSKEFFYHFCLVETDLADMRGVDFLRMVKGIHPDTAVILLTRKPSLENSVEALNAGASAYLLKPVKTDDMMKHISGVLERQKSILETRELLFAERKKREFYQYLSIRDGLTDLYNHRHFHELLNQELAPAFRYDQPLSLLLIDIDDFKKFNDSYGHPAGDNALQQIARIFQENCRRMDHVCRYGGEEFAIITPETSAPNAVHPARRLLTKMRETKIQVYDSSIAVNLAISIGVATYPTDATNKGDLILKADHNLLQAKKAGKNCAFPPLK